MLSMKPTTRSQRNIDLETGQKPNEHHRRRKRSQETHQKLTQGLWAWADLVSHLYQIPHISTQTDWVFCALRMPYAIAHPVGESGFRPGFRADSNRANFKFGRNSNRKPDFRVGSNIAKHA